MERMSFPRLKGLRVLVVDDHRDSADSLAMLFAMVGCEARVAYSGEDALRCVDTFEPQIIVLDLIMSAPDGYEVARQISSRQQQERPILAALSGYSHHDDELKQRLKHAGFDHYFLKPADIGELFSILSRTVSQRTALGLMAEWQAA